MENVTNNQDNIQKPKNKILKVVKYVILTIVVLYLIIVVVRVFQINENRKDEEKVKEIHSIRLTMKDIDDANLPPMPDMALNNSTVEGIDVNHNYVRDDVERYIFETYKTKEERAAWLQYARARSFVMTRADSKETLKEILKEEDRADMCTLDIYKKQEGMNLKKFDSMTDPIDEMIVNTEIRKSAKNKAYENLTTSEQSNELSCDLFNN